MDTVKDMQTVFERWQSFLAKKRRCAHRIGSTHGPEALTSTALACVASIDMANTKAIEAFYNMQSSITDTCAEIANLQEAQKKHQQSVAAMRRKHNEQHSWLVKLILCRDDTQNLLESYLTMRETTALRLTCSCFHLFGSAWGKIVMSDYLKACKTPRVVAVCHREKVGQPQFSCLASYTKHDHAAVSLTSISKVDSERSVSAVVVPLWTTENVDNGSPTVSMNIGTAYNNSHAGRGSKVMYGTAVELYRKEHQRQFGSVQECNLGANCTFGACNKQDACVFFQAVGAQMVCRIAYVCNKVKSNPAVIVINSGRYEIWEELLDCSTTNPRLLYTRNAAIPCDAVGVRPDSCDLCPQCLYDKDSDMLFAVSLCKIKWRATPTATRGGVFSQCNLLPTGMLTVVCNSKTQHERVTYKVPLPSRVVRHTHPFLRRQTISSTRLSDATNYCLAVLQNSGKRGDCVIRVAQAHLNSAWCVKVDAIPVGGFDMNRYRGYLNLHKLQCERDAGSPRITLRELLNAITWCKWSRNGEPFVNYDKASALFVQNGLVSHKLELLTDLPIFDLPTRMLAAVSALVSHESVLCLLAYPGCGSSVPCSDQWLVPETMHAAFGLKTGNLEQTRSVYCPYKALRKTLQMLRTTDFSCGDNNLCVFAFGTCVYGFEVPVVGEGRQFNGVTLAVQERVYTMLREMKKYDKQICRSVARMFSVCNRDFSKLTGHIHVTRTANWSKTRVSLQHSTEAMVQENSVSDPALQAASKQMEKLLVEMFNCEENAECLANVVWAHFDPWTARCGWVGHVSEETYCGRNLSEFCQSRNIVQCAEAEISWRRQGRGVNDIDAPLDRHIACALDGLHCMASGGKVCVKQLSPEGSFVFGFASEKVVHNNGERSKLHTLGFLQVAAKGNLLTLSPFAPYRMCEAGSPYVSAEDKCVFDALHRGLHFSVACL